MVQGLEDVVVDSIAALAAERAPLATWGRPASGPRWASSSAYDLRHAK